MDFLTIEYLKEGNERQKLAYQTLVTHQIFENLSAFSPILTGTIPINIDIETSDLDIICYWTNKAEFIEKLKQLYGNKAQYQLSDGASISQDTVVCNFLINDFEIEIFGQNIPTQHQNAYLHMLIEHEILQEKGENFRKQIIALKQKGLKTEPAFAKLLNLTGDPYLALLQYKIS